MTDPSRSPIGRAADLFFGLTEAEQEQARANAGKPWRTAYYVAGRDWPVPHPDVLTSDEAWAAVRLVVALHEDGGNA